MILLFIIIVIVCICFLKFIFSIVGWLGKQAGKSQENLQKDIRTQAMIDALKQNRENSSNKEDGSISIDDGSPQQKLNKQQKENQNSYIIWTLLFVAAVVFLAVLFLKK